MSGASDPAVTARRRRPSVFAVVAGLLAVLAFAGFATIVLRAQELPKGPVEVAWDREACTHCRMHIGQPAFAVQVHLTDGRVLHFDDPGCMFAWQAQHADPVHAIWLRHHRREEWLRQSAAAFLPATDTPMGYGIAAVGAGEPGAISWDRARALVLAPRARASTGAAQRDAEAGAAAPARHGEDPRQ